MVKTSRQCCRALIFLQSTFWRLAFTCACASPFANARSEKIGPTIAPHRHLISGSLFSLLGIAKRVDSHVAHSTMPSEPVISSMEYFLLSVCGGPSTVTCNDTPASTSRSPKRPLAIWPPQPSQRRYAIAYRWAVVSAFGLNWLELCKSFQTSQASGVEQGQKL